MNILIYLLLITNMGTKLIFEFTSESDIKNWNVIDDIVMGGKSSGSFKLTTDGYGVFKGNVSLENNGGFSSVKYKFPNILIDNKSKISFKVKGDGKDYQFRIKENSSDRHSYISLFSTTGDWQEIEIPLNNFYPSFRGKTLDIPNFSKQHIEEISFLISNKHEENFKLLIKKIELK